MNLYKNATKSIVLITGSEKELEEMPFKVLRLMSNSAKDTDKFSSGIVKELAIGVAAPEALNDEQVEEIYNTIQTTPEEWENLPIT